MSNEARQRAAAFLANLIESEDLDYVDNERIANADDLEEVAAFEAARRGGCCGSLNREYFDAETGITFLVGCNHGH